MYSKKKKYILWLRKIATIKGVRCHQKMIKTEHFTISQIYYSNLMQVLKNRLFLN